MKKDCPFCQPSMHEITFLESEHFRAVYNLAPILPGHSLILPHEHRSSLFEFSPDVSAALIHFSTRVIALLKKAYSCEGFDLSLQEKPEAGQSIEHFHIHIIPRKPNDLDKPGDWFPEMERAERQFIDSAFRPKLSREEMIQQVNFIRSFINK